MHREIEAIVAEQALAGLDKSTVMRQLLAEALKLDTLADETTLTHAIAAGWEPEEDGDTTRPVSEQAAARDDGGAGAPDLDDLVERGRDGLMASKHPLRGHCTFRAQVA
jgi:hypothetical protein